MLRKILFLSILLNSLFLFADKITYDIEIYPKGDIHPVGTKVKFVGKLFGNNKTPKDGFVRYEEYLDGIRKRVGYAKYQDKIILERIIKNPGCFDVCLQIVDKNKRLVNIPSLHRKSIGKGVLIAPEKLERSGIKPIDFDLFWQSRRDLLNKVPIKELYRRQLKVPKNLTDKVIAFDITVSCAGNGPVSGVLTMPNNAEKKSLPAIVLFMGAGVHSANINTTYGQYAITFQMNPHSIKNLQPKEYYQNLAKTSLFNYSNKNINNRDKIYFHDMFLRVMRSLDYVKSLPEWNGKVLIVKGGSQGGAQSIVAAALDNNVTMMIAEVPAMCDHSALLMTKPRLHGWPRFYNAKASKEVIKATSYYDMINFASKIKCKSFVTAGALDHVCSPCGVFAAYNEIASKDKQFLFHPYGNHILTQVDSMFRATYINEIFNQIKK